MSETTDTAATEDAVSADDWAAAMNEQQATADTAHNAEPAKIFQPLSGEQGAAQPHQGFDLVMDIPVSLTVELGRTRISIRNLLQLAHGSIVELDGMAGEPMNVLINGTLIAQGEVVVVNEKFGIRLTDIITPQERISKLNR